MPTYDYVCDACGHKFEEFQSFSANPLTDCPACQQPKLRRLFGTGAAILFKGSGFYETDYRSEGYKSAEKSDQAAAKPAETKSGDSAAKPSEGAKTGDSGKSDSSVK
jgi:putative FmdB family regulatory protein